MQNVVKCAEVANSFAATVSYSSQIWVEMALIGQPKAAYESASTIGADDGTAGADGAAGAADGLGAICLLQSCTTL